jgi:DNA-binding MarR family transcriptional regulator
MARKNSSKYEEFFFNIKINKKYYACILFFITFENKSKIMKEKTIDYILRATWQAVSRMYNDEAQNFGASMATGFALLSMDKDKGTPSTSLGPKMGMEATSLTRTLKSMEEKGLIIRKKNPEDGRGVLIYLTDFGREKRELSRNTVLKFNDTVKKHVSEEKLKHFSEVTDIINDLIIEKKIFSPRENTTDQKNK